MLDRAGKPRKVIKFATDITSQKTMALEDAGKIAAVDRAQAVIEFNLDGTIITANENFLKTMGYSLEEIKGRHHSMFVEAEVRGSAAYQDFVGKAQPGRIAFRRVQASWQERQGDLDTRIL